VSSRELAGRPVDGFPGLQYAALSPADCAAFATRAGGGGAVDAWVLALPNGHAASYVSALRPDVAATPAATQQGPVLVDLSADMRFDARWQYGLPERRRAALARATLISNPGCYATGADRPHSVRARAYMHVCVCVCVCVCVHLRMYVCERERERVHAVAGYCCGLCIALPPCLSMVARACLKKAGA
jgi:hypothetical protein